MIKNLAKIRKGYGITQSELAYICGVSRNTICSLERGEYLPGSLLLLKLQYALYDYFVYDLDDFERQELDKRIKHICKVREMKAAQR